MKDRINALEALGFEIFQDDRKVVVSTYEKSCVVDFSSVSIDNFLIHALHEMYLHGKKQGRSEVRTSLRDLILRED